VSSATRCNNKPPPRCNRVVPFGDIEATGCRGTLMGNRGDLAGRNGTVSVKWRLKRWITCTLEEVGGRRVAFDSPGRYTPLFFADEAVSLAAGHRPCARCRRNSYEHFRDRWRAAHGLPDDAHISATEIDDILHAARIDSDGRKVTHEARLADLPDGVFLTISGAPRKAFLLWSGCVHPWSHEGYGEPQLLPPQTVVTTITPKPIIGVIRSGYRPSATVRSMLDGYLHL